MPWLRPQNLALHRGSSFTSDRPAKARAKAGREAILHLRSATTARWEKREKKADLSAD